MAVWRVPATITWPGKGSPGVNVWSVRTTEASVVADELQGAVNALHTFYNSLTTYLATGVQVTIGPDIIERDSLADESRAAQSVNSSALNSYIAPALQLCISWRTSLRARRGMGRTFIGPLSLNAEGGDGTPSAGFINAAQAAANALIEASDSATGWAIGVWGLESPGAYDQFGRLLPDLPHVHRDIVVAKVRDQYAVLRSRRD